MVLAVTNDMKVSEQMVEFLLSELVLYAKDSCIPNSTSKTSSSASSNASVSGSTTDGQASQENHHSTNNNNNNNSTTGGGTAASTTQSPSEEALTISAEQAAAKLERIGFAVGFRLTERLAQHKTWNAVPPTATPKTTTTGGSSSGTAGSNASMGGRSGGGVVGSGMSGAGSLLSPADMAAAVAAQQLEAVKFLCKEVWTDMFGKQIDKLQTNHRGVFVLKDLNLKWLSRFPSGTEQARVTAIRLLAFPCGLIRGCLSNLGIPAVVSCDFLADGQNMAACSFNIKVK